ncbi:tyrosine kinase receptor Cad96Ca [Hyalella azteca]|uniref:Tyrosine kinase receptor Cad96Ca n=1 Tax=Hyalella azteca TaxID=294128 RepID=A0A979FLC0_HYAAZ|nr:tyrosine kinase receptor Cad96Ca [Hyalella azteca]
MCIKQHLTDARALTHYPVYAEKHRRFSTIAEQQVLSILCGVARGLQWLHSCGVAHGAVCARNVVLVDGTVAKLTGFGLLSYTNDVYEPDYRRWVARELLTHWPASNGVAAGEQATGAARLSSVHGDIWSLGVLMWEAVTLGATPYPDLPTDQVTPRVQTGLRLPQPQYISNDLYQMFMGQQKFGNTTSNPGP